MRSGLIGPSTKGGATAVGTGRGGGIVGDDGVDGDRARGVVALEDLSVPDLVDVEVVSVLRRRWLGKTMTARRFAAAVEDLSALPADRYPVLPFMPRAFELRANVSAYDATYVALAEQLGCVLLTADARLATASGPRCKITLIERQAQGTKP